MGCLPKGKVPNEKPLNGKTPDGKTPTGKGTSVGRQRNMQEGAVQAWLSGCIGPYVLDWGCDGSNSFLLCGLLVAASKPVACCGLVPRE